MKNIYKSVLLVLLLAGTLAGVAQVPIFNSYTPPPPATSSPVIFLDFDGHTVTGTGWNVYASVIQAAPSGLNSDQITDIYNRMAEDYRPFTVSLSYDVNISRLTTSSYGRGGFELSLKYAGFLNRESSTSEAMRCPRF